MPNGEKLGLYFIDTDNDKNSYEMFEYIRVDKNGDAVKRGIIKRINFRNNKYGRSVRLHVFKLSTTDPKDYAPNGEMTDFISSDDVYDFFSRIIDEQSNNGSISRFRSKTGYDNLGYELQDYKRVLGLTK